MDELRLHLHRRYPQLIHATNELHQRSISSKNSNTITATFGSILHSQQNSNFTNKLSETMFDEISKLLTSFQQWSFESDWVMCVNYEHNGQGWCILHDDIQSPTIEHYILDQSPLYFSYNHSGGSYDRLLQISFNERNNSQTENSAFAFSMVEISIRKLFRIASSHLSDVLFDFELLQSWYGKSFAEAEENLKNSKPTYSFICMLKGISNLSAEQIWLSLLSLLLKLQDFIDIPFYSNLMQTHEKLNHIPIFTPTII